MIPYADHRTVNGRVRNGHGKYKTDEYRIFNGEFRGDRITLIETGLGRLSLKDSQVRDLIVALFECVPEIGAKQ